jgi:hypothetical protein
LLTATDFKKNEGGPTVLTKQLSDAKEVPLPSVFALHGAQPNPFNPVTTIRTDGRECRYDIASPPSTRTAAAVPSGSGR